MSATKSAKKIDPFSRGLHQGYRALSFGVSCFPQEHRSSLGGAPLHAQHAPHAAQHAAPLRRSTVHGTNRVLQAEALPGADLWILLQSSSSCYFGCYIPRLLGICWVLSYCTFRTQLTGLLYSSTLALSPFCINLKVSFLKH